MTTKERVIDKIVKHIIRVKATRCFYGTSKKGYSFYINNLMRFFPTLEVRDVACFVENKKEIINEVKKRDFEDTKAKKIYLEMIRHLSIKRLVYLNETKKQGVKG